MGASLLVVEYQLRVARRYWRSLLVTGLITPLLYVLALGVGLGVVIDDQPDAALGVPYLQFVAPALVTATALQLAAGDSTYPVMSGFRWERTFQGIAVTPLRPAQICDGQLLWMALRLLVNSAAYLAVMASFGAARTWGVLLCVPVALLTGMAFAAPVTAFAANVADDARSFGTLFRFVVTPMFLFSGTFFPISQLPAWGGWLARVSPLWHGTELARGAALGSGLTVGAATVHVLYLGGLLVAGVVVARRQFRVRLELGAS